MNPQQQRPGNHPPPVGNPSQMVPPQPGMPIIRPVNVNHGGNKHINKQILQAFLTIFSVPIRPVVQGQSPRPVLPPGVRPPIKPLANAPIRPVVPVQHSGNQIRPVMNSEHMKTQTPPVRPIGVASPQQANLVASMQNMHIQQQLLSPPQLVIKKKEIVEHW